MKTAAPWLLTAALLLAPVAQTPRAQQNGTSANPLASASTALAPTAHPQVPSDLSLVWLAPDRSTAGSPSTAVASIGSAAKLTVDGAYTRVLGLVSQPTARQGLLGQYAAYYAGVAQLKLKRGGEALESFRALQAQTPVGYLAEGAALGEADALEALAKPDEAVRIYKRLLKGRLSDVEDVYMRLGRAARTAGDRDTAAEAFGHVFYEFPLGDAAAAAGAQLDELTGQQPLAPGSQRYKVELGRAERLFGAKQYADARISFDRLRSASTGDDRELLQLRIAECDYFTKKTRAAVEALRPLTTTATRRAEALLYFGMATRQVGDADTFKQTLERVAREFPEQPWAEQALDVLGNFYLRTDEDDKADATFRQLYERYPRGAYSEHAAWKIGWTSYRNGLFEDTTRVFERAASDFPRSDFRPAWLYWAGRAHEELRHAAVAQDRYALAAADYANTYYGRLALKRLDTGTSSRLASARIATQASAAAGPTLPANGPMVRALLAAEMYDDALNELRYAQRVWGDSSAIQATIAWTRQQQSRTESGMRRFSLLRGAINTMRRAYPQFMAAGGDTLPREVLTVIFPLAYWDLIRKYSDENGLDPYLVAALVAQESTFVADVKSGANAYGLMQLLPSTARMYARKLNLKYSTRLLIDPEANIRMGTAYLADKVREFGDLHLVLASYNAGERPVHRWQNERPGLDTDVFIDDIPYPETQNYVKRIIGTADDYRHLYSTVTAADGLETTRVATVAASVTPERKPAPQRKVVPRKSAPRKRPAGRTR